MVHEQEICAYSNNTRFTAHATAGEELALLQLRMTPRATVKLTGALSKAASVLVKLGALKCSHMQAQAYYSPHPTLHGRTFSFAGP